MARPEPGGPEGSNGGQGRRRLAAVVLAVVGVVAGVVLWFVAGVRYDNAVRDLARAPVGCDTTVDFAAAGDYLVFVESRGSFADVRGDCELSGGFELEDGRTPSVEVTVVDPDGVPVDLLSRRGRESYDRAGSTGESLARLPIAEAGDHVVRVESSGDEAFAVAIGRDPADGVALLRLLGIGIAVLGLLGAGLLALTGRRRPTPATVAAPAPVPSGAWGAPPPSGPPPMHAPSGPPAPPWQAPSGPWPSAAGTDPDRPGSPAAPGSTWQPVPPDAAVWRPSPPSAGEPVHPDDPDRPDERRPGPFAPPG